MKAILPLFYLYHNTTSKQKNQEKNEKFFHFLKICFRYFSLNWKLFSLEGA